MDDVAGQVADLADSVAASQRQVAENAGAIAAQRRAGRPWRRILDERAGRDLLAGLRADAARLAALSRRVVTTVVDGLAREGESRRRIAERLGVSHQRVTTILRQTDGSNGARTGGEASE